MLDEKQCSERLNHLKGRLDHITRAHNAHFQLQAAQFKVKCKFDT